MDCDMEQNYGREEGEINDSSVEELMEPIYDEHNGTQYVLLLCNIFYSSSTVYKFFPWNK